MNSTFIFSILTLTLSLNLFAKEIEIRKMLIPNFEQSFKISCNQDKLEQVQYLRFNFKDDGTSIVNKEQNLVESISNLSELNAKTVYINIGDKKKVLVGYLNLKNRDLERQCIQNNTNPDHSIHYFYDSINITMLKTIKAFKVITKAKKCIPKQGFWYRSPIVWKGKFNNYSYIQIEKQEPLLINTTIFKGIFKNLRDCQNYKETIFPINE